MKGRFLAAFVFDAFAGLLLIPLAWLLATVLDGLVFSNTAPTAQTLAVVAGLLSARLLFLGLQAKAAGDIGVRAGAMIRRRLAHGLMAGGRTDPVPPAGSAALLMVEGVEAVEPLFARYIPAVFQAAYLPFAILVVVFPLDLVTALTLALTAPLIPAFMVLVGKGAITLNAEQWAAMNRLSAYFLDAVRALPLLRVFGAVERETRAMADASEIWRDGAFKVLRIAFLSSLALEFFATLGVALVAVFIGFKLLFGEIDYARGLFLLLLAPEFYRPLRMLGVNYHARMESIAAAEKLAPLLRPVDDRPEAAPPPTPPAAGAMKTAPHVTMTGVSFAYGGEAPVLNDLTLSLAPGSLTALVGASGVGKTTVLDLLRGRLTPDRGKVLIDGRPPDLLGQRPVWTPQEPHPFAGTLREAVTLGRPGAADAEVWAALRAAGADGFIESRALGLDSPIGEGGFGLSGGEVRRLALARAFLTDASLVLLDEPTASLDQDSEASFTETLKKLTPERTVLVAAHRLATIRASERIVVLDNGRIVEDGAFDDLLAANGAFTRLLGAASPLVALALSRETKP